MSDNPYERYGLNPLASVAELTEALREKIEDADEEERKALRAAWDELARHPERRLLAALTTFIDPDPPRPVPPPRAPALEVRSAAPSLTPLSGALDLAFEQPPPDPSPSASILDDPLFKDETR